MDLKVRLGLAFLGRLGFAEGLVLAQMLAHELLQVGLVSSLGDDALFLQHGQDAHLLLNELDGDDQIHTKIHESPLDTFGLVLFLFLDEHVVVEELLKTLVGVVDQKLFQDVQLENLETSNVKTPMKFFLGLGVSSESFTRATTQSNMRAKRDLQVAETEKLTWSTF